MTRPPRSRSCTGPAANVVSRAILAKEHPVSGVSSPGPRYLRELLATRKIWPMMPPGRAANRDIPGYDARGDRHSTLLITIR